MAMNRLKETNGAIAVAEKPSIKTKELPPLNKRTMEVWIRGDSELICHRFSPEKQEQMLDKQKGTPKGSGREKRDPEADYKGTLYAHPDGHGFPASAIKRACVEACTSLGKTMTKVQSRQAFFVVGDMLLIEGSEPYMRQDVVRNASGVADLRFRAAFKEWSIRFQIRYNANVLTSDQLLNLINVAGFAVGIGDWRPECDGNFGQFHVEKVMEYEDSQKHTKR